MATFNSTTLAGISDSTSIFLDNSADVTEWYKIAVPFVLSDTYVHVRTPWPADAVAGMGWNPYIIEVVGFSHKNATTYTFDLKAIINTTGDGNNSWYGNQIKSDSGLYQSTYTESYFYRSSSTYGGYTRVCFSFKHLGYQPLAGHIWFKVWTNAGFRTSYAWGQTTNAARTGAF